MKVIREFQKEPPKITFSIEQAAECERQLKRASTTRT